MLVVIFQIKHECKTLEIQRKQRQQAARSVSTNFSAFSTQSRAACATVNPIH